MSYEVRCACGKAHAVSAADAGSSLSCTCGRTVDVPPLHQLRAAVGEAVLSPEVRIETLLLEGRLPGTRECAVCFEETHNLIHVQAVCERGRMTAAEGSSRDEVAGGCLFALVVGGPLGIFGGNRLMRNEAEAPKQIGQDVAFTLPLPVCTGCRAKLNDLAALRIALRHIPDYAALLDRYPDTRIVIVGCSIP